MSKTLTIRLDEELSNWLEEAAAQSGVSQGRIVRDALSSAKQVDSTRRFMRLAGAVRGSRDLSKRKGFAKG